MKVNHTTVVPPRLNPCQLPLGWKCVSNNSATCMCSRCTMMAGMSSTRSWVAVIVVLIPRASLKSHFLAKTRTKCQSFMYVQQLFQEIGIGVDENVSRVLGHETYFSADGPTSRLQGPSAVVIHSAVESVPSIEDIRAFGASLQAGGIANTIFFINESVYRTSYLGLAEHPLRQMGVNAVVLCLEDLAYQVLTTEVYRKYESKLVWAYSNSF